MEAVLEYTLPAYDQDIVYSPDEGDSVAVCGADQGRPITGLAAVRVYVQGMAGPVLYREKALAGQQPGETDTTHVLLDEPRLMFITTLDAAGNESCASNGITVGPVGTGVEETPVRPAREVWYDVHGRRVARPGPIGFFWRVTPGKREKFLFLGSTQIKVKEERE